MARRVECSSGVLTYPLPQIFLLLPPAVNIWVLYSLDSDRLINVVSHFNASPLFGPSPPILRVLITGREPCVARNRSFPAFVTAVTFGPPQVFPMIRVL